jgi:hypothetical protein
MKQLITSRLWVSQPGVTADRTLRSEAALAGAIPWLNKPIENVGTKPDRALPEAG